MCPEDWYDLAAAELHVVARGAIPANVFKNSNIKPQLSSGNNVPTNCLDVAGSGPPGYCYNVCLTPESTKNDFMFLKPYSPSPTRNKEKAAENLPGPGRKPRAANNTVSATSQDIPAGNSQPLSTSMDTDLDPPPQPVLGLDPPSGAVSEGLPLLIICAVSRDAREWRFHFYKDGAEIIPGDMGSEINTTEPGTVSMNVSVLSIPQAGPNNTGEFTCRYEENVSGRWIPSPRSRAVNVTVNVTGTASYSTRDILLTTGGLLLLVGAIAALICYCRRKKRVPKPQKNIEGSEPRGCARNLHPDHDHQGSKARVPGAEQMEQGSEVTYALMVFPALEAQATQSKNKAKPAEDEHVLYSEVVTTCTRKAAK
nr:uncharacterized protein LOC103307162 [Chrysemys picta bellii]